MVPDRDHFMDELLKKFARATVDPVPMDAEAPLFLMYTSGTTGKPKGCQHRTGGYMAYVTGTSKVLSGHSSRRCLLVHGGYRLDHGTFIHRVRAAVSRRPRASCLRAFPTIRMLAGPGKSPSDSNVNIFHTSPTAIRMLRKSGPKEPEKYNYHFKHMTTVGEPIEPESWRWYYHVVGKGEAAIVDTWWQTENGGFLCTTLPALNPMKPGSAGPGALGIYPTIYDEEGKDIPAGSGKAGNICIRNPWPGIMQTIWGDDDRFVKQYYSKYCQNPESKDWHDWPYFAADGAVLPADGYYRILGRVDDVINVAGHRLGTKELESACLTIPEVAEAAVVPVVDEIKGRVPAVYVSLVPGVSNEQAVSKKVVTTIEKIVGKIARPKTVHVVPDLPKTRSGKIMRRVLAAISNTMDTGDVTTLANPDIVESDSAASSRRRTCRAEGRPGRTSSSSARTSSRSHVCESRSMRACSRRRLISRLRPLMSLARPDPPSSGITSSTASRLTTAAREIRQKREGSRRASRSVSVGCIHGIRSVVWSFVRPPSEGKEQHILSGNDAVPRAAFR